MPLKRIARSVWCACKKYWQKMVNNNRFACVFNKKKIAQININKRMYKRTTTTAESKSPPYKNLQFNLCIFYRVTVQNVQRGYQQVVQMFWAGIYYSTFYFYLYINIPDQFQTSFLIGTVFLYLSFIGRYRSQFFPKFGKSEWKSQSLKICVISI